MTQEVYFQIRLANSTDLPYLLSIDKASCEREGILWDEFERQKLISKFVQDDRWFSIVAEADGKRVGAILLHVRSTSDDSLLRTQRSLLHAHIGAATSFVDIFDIWVDPYYRRVGIAKALKNATEDVCRVRHIPWIFTFQHPENIAAIRMNETLGYTFIAIEKMYDAVPRICFLREVVF